MIKLPKRVISTLLILATLIAAVYYFSKHRDLLSELKHIPPGIIVSIFGLYLVMLLVLIVIFSATLNIANKKLGFKENGLLNAYSLFMNFFIPGQTGPAFRGYYLKKKHNLKVLDYTLATLLYYLFYGLLSLIFVLAGSKPWWLTLAATVALIIISLIGSSLYLKKYRQERLNLSFQALLYLLGATLMQTILQMIIYFIELHSINHSIRISQVITYTGTANLALFVALTPGAIGIRESFLILTERLNHISSSNILLANIIDRSVYIVFLLVLGLAIFLLKVNEKLGVDRKNKSEYN